MQGFEELDHTGPEGIADQSERDDQRFPRVLSQEAEHPGCFNFHNVEGRRYGV